MLSAALVLGTSDATFRVSHCMSSRHIVDRQLWIHDDTDNLAMDPRSRGDVEIAIISETFGGPWILLTVMSLRINTSVNLSGLF